MRRVSRGGSGPFSQSVGTRYRRLGDSVERIFPRLGETARTTEIIDLLEEAARWLAVSSVGRARCRCRVERDTTRTAVVLVGSGCGAGRNSPVGIHRYAGR